MIPGIDDITGVTIQAGGENVTEEIHTICHQISQEGRVPEDWGKLKVRSKENLIMFN